MNTSTVKAQRSHSGCLRCRTRKQKCDGIRPHCGRCTSADVPCDYSVNLRWGGRTFDKSRFGTCLKQRARKVSGDKQEFIYTTLAVDDAVPKGLPILGPSMPVFEQRLLLHFTEEASRVTCCNPHVQAELCALIVPMAAVSPALKNATLAWAALHSLTTRGNIPGKSKAESRLSIEIFKARSIENLRRELQVPDLATRDTLLATIRTLCQCEIHSGSDELSTWRVHIKGAKALMETIQGKHGGSSSRTETGSRLLRRWYASLDSLALLAPARNTDTMGNSGDDMDDIDTSDVYLDDYNGYATDLSSLLGRIGRTISSKRQFIGGVDKQQLEVEANLLEGEVCRIMERDNSRNPVFFPGVSAKLNPEAIQNYAWCNQAYQHTALLHIRCRLRNLRDYDPTVQDSVKTIIECARAITPNYGLSPAIVMTTPLFTAGCEALGSNRDAIRELLSQLYESLKIRNIRLALEALEIYWEKDVDEEIETVLRRQNWDFIPY